MGRTIKSKSKPNKGKSKKQEFFLGGLKADLQLIAGSLAKTTKLKFAQLIDLLKRSPKLILAFIKSIPSRWRAQVKKWRGKNGYISFRRENYKKPEKKAAGPLSLVVETFSFLKTNYKVLLPIAVLYAIFYFVIVRVNINFDQESTVDATKKIFDLSGASVLTRISNLAGVVSSYRPSGSEQANTLSSVLIVIFSLIYIWAIRALNQGKKIRARDAIYSGTTNMMAFLLIVAIIALQMLPLTLTVVAYNMGDNGLIFIYWYERTAALIGLGLIAVLTLYFASSSIMALYAATIPGVYPLAVMRSTREIVRFQRPRILLSLIAGILMMFIIYLIILLLIVTYVPKFTPWMLDIFNVISLPAVHVYMYKLYRSVV